MPRYSDFEYLIASQTDTFDTIAYDLYGDEFRSVDIIELNPQYSGCIMFDGGEVLKVPVYDDETATEGAAPWRRAT